MSVLQSPPGKYTPFSVLSAASTNATLVATGKRKLGMLAATNVNASPRYLKVYDKATAPAETDTPAFRFLIPGNTTGTGTNIPLPDEGIWFLLGIGIRLTTGAADNDNTGVSANENIVNGAYV